MRIITPPLVVEENDSFKNDALDRKTYGEALLKESLIKSPEIAKITINVTSG
jgi:hypothetical protein